MGRKFKRCARGHNRSKSGRILSSCDCPKCLRRRRENDARKKGRRESASKIDELEQKLKRALSANRNLRARFKQLEADWVELAMARSGAALARIEAERCDERPR